MGRSKRSEQLITKTEAAAEHVMVTAEHAATADAALRVLNRGGNAVDAAVTAGFVAAVAEPALSGIGGVAVMLIRSPDGRQTVIEGGSAAPFASRPGMFELEPAGSRKGMYGWPSTTDNANNLGYLSVGVPGMPAAMAYALEQYGTIPLADALGPAIDLARRGIEVDHYLALQLAGYADRLWAFPEARGVFYGPGGLPLRPPLGLEPAQRLVQGDLARTLERLAADGIDVLYRGPIARAIVEDVRANGGLLAFDDFASYRPRERPTLIGSYKGYQVSTIPELGGGTTLIQALNVLERTGLSSESRWGSGYCHLLAEVQRLVFRDRLELLGDPDHVAAPFARLLTTEHAQTLFEEVDPARTQPEVAETEAPADQPDTTHICVVDSDRMCVALTSTLGQAFGSGVVPAGTGIVLADVMTWFDPRVGRPNSIAPGKRILWAPAPTFLSHEDRPRLVVGGLGGRKLITAVLQVILNMVDHLDGPGQAVNGLRIHGEASETLIDERVPTPVREALTAKGHRIVVRAQTISSSPFGRANAISISDKGLRGGVTALSPSIAVGT